MHAHDTDREEIFLSHADVAALGVDPAVEPDAPAVTVRLPSSRPPEPLSETAALTAAERSGAEVERARAALVTAFAKYHNAEAAHGRDLAALFAARRGGQS